MATHRQPVLTVIIYLRVSTGEQARRGYSLPEQRRECLARAENLAAERGAQLQVHEFQDAVGGDWLERPELDRVREFLRRQRVDAFICMDPDRFSRNLTNQLLIDEEIRRRGTEPVYVSGSYADTAEGQLFFAVRGAISQFDKAKILERTTRGKRGKIAAGGIPHQFSAFGYRYIKGIRANAANPCPLEVDEAEARWVRMMFRWCAEEGMNPQQIAERLTAMGVPTPRSRSGRWQRSTVNDILRNTVYYGQAALNQVDAGGMQALRQFPREWRRQRYEALRAAGRADEAQALLLTGRRRPRSEWRFVPVPAIVDRPLWDQAQAFLNSHAKHRTGLEERELSGFGMCGLCGAPLHYGQRSEDGHRYLVCANANRRAGDPRKCKLARKRAATVHQTVWREVTSWIMEPGRLEAVAAEIAGGQAPGVPAGLEAEADALRDQLEAKHEERGRWTEMYARGIISIEKLEGAAAAVDAQLAALQERVDAIAARLAAERPRRLAAGVADAAAALRAEAGQVLASATPARRRAICEDLLGRFTLLPSGPGSEPVVICEPRME